MDAFMVFCAWPKSAQCWFSPVSHLWRDGRVVDCDGLENRRPKGPGVRIPLPPPELSSALTSSEGRFSFPRIGEMTPILTPIGEGSDLKDLLVLAGWSDT